MATDSDILLYPVDTRLPFSLLLEADIVGSLWVAQLGSCIGRLSSDLLSAITKAVRGNFTGISDPKRGFPIRGRQDPRWKWKQRELTALHELGSDCLSSIVDERELRAVMLGPDLLLPPQAEDEIWKTKERIVRLVDRFGGNVELPPLDVLESLVEGEGFNVETWRRRLGLDAWNALQRVCQRNPWPRAEPKRALRGQVIWHPKRAADSRATEELSRMVIGLATQGRRSIRLATTEESWGLGKESSLHGCLAVDLPKAGRVQIVPEFLGEDK
jgi:hypothetical protein